MPISKEREEEIRETFAIWYRSYQKDLKHKPGMLMITNQMLKILSSEIEAERKRIAGMVEGLMESMGGKTFEDKGPILPITDFQMAKGYKCGVSDAIAIIDNG